jgi:hypothetical protein
VSTTDILLVLSVVHSVTIIGLSVCVILLAKARRP